MTRFKLYLLNAVCFFLLIYVTFLVGLQTSVSAERYDTDYQTLYLSFHSPNQDAIYAEHPHAPIVLVKKIGTNTSVETKPLISAVNMNSPMMSFALKGIFNISHDLVTNVGIWTVLSLLSAALGIGILMPLFFESSWKLYFLPVLTVLYFSWPSFYNLRLGELSYLLLPLLSFAFLCQQKGREHAMTVTFALLASLKLFFLIFALYFVVKQQWRFLCLFCLYFLAFSFLPLIYFHWDVYRAFYYVAENARLLVQHSTFPTNGSLMGIVARIDRLCSLSLGDHLVRTLSLLAVVLVLMVWVLYDYNVIRKLPKYRDETRFFCLIVLCLLCSPLGWIYYYVYLIIPSLFLWKMAYRYTPPNLFYAFFALAVFLPCFSSYYDARGFLFYVEIFSASVSLCCWVICLSLMNKAVRSEKSCVTYDWFIPAVFILHIIINFILVSQNYGAPYLFSRDKTAYLKNAQVVLTAPDIVKK